MLIAYLAFRETSIKMRILPAGALLLCLCAAASAQSAKDFSPAGAYITAPVREELGQARASEFLKAASSAGFTSREARLIARGLREANIRAVHVSANGWRGVFKTPHGTVSVDTIEQAGLIRRAMGYVPYANFFEQYATIRLQVKSARPRDYKVTINGEACPRSKTSTYLVRPGRAKLSMTHGGKPLCTWAGAVFPGREITVECKL